MDTTNMLVWLIVILCSLIGYKCYRTFYFFYEAATRPIGQPAYARKRAPPAVNTPPPPRVLIIGAGPAGIGAAGALNHLGIDNLVIERSDKIAGSWKGHYKRLHLHTINQYSHLPHVPFPPHFPLFVPREMFAGYIEGYAKMMGVNINFNETVTTVSCENKAGKQAWKVKTTKNDKETTYHVDFVIVCTGENIIPVVPTFPDQELFKGTVIHSSKYYTANTYRGKKVLVVGFGNTGGELAIDLHEHDCDVHIVVRSPVNIIKRHNAALAPVVGRYLPQFVQEAIGWLTIRLDYSDVHKYGITCPIDSGFKNSIFKRLTIYHDAPHIDIGQIDLIRKNLIKVQNKEIERFTPTGVVFKGGKEETYDVVVLATGFKPNLSQILSQPVYNSAVTELGFPKVQEELARELPGLFFIGFSDEAGRILQMNDDSIVMAKTIKAQL